MSGADRPILIVGGGLGGLATALALGRKGRPVRVLEGAPEFGAIGYGIQLGPNVFYAFDRLGVTEAVMRHAIEPISVRMVDALNGAEVTRVPTGKPSFRQRFKHPYIVLHRVDLHSALLEACREIPSIALDPDAEVVGFEDRGDYVVGRTGEGRIVEGAALIGADGLGSVVRGKLLGDSKPRLIGYVAHRTIVPMDQIEADVTRDDVVLWAGPGFHIVTYPLRHYTLFNIVAVFRTSTYAEKGDVEGYRAELQRTYRSAHPAMHALLGKLDLQRRWAISDRDPVRHWSRGRVTLLGDAAHPTLQTYAQGACMAIEDAACLADLIDMAGDDYETAFRSYEAARCVRTARVTLESRSLWEVYHLDGLAREALWQGLSDRSEQDIYRCLAWLYDGASVARSM